MMSGQTSARRTKSASGEAGFEEFERFERFEGLPPKEGFERFEEFERVEGSGFSEDSERVEWVAGSGAAWWRQEVRVRENVRESARAARKRICL